jgi:hypothetical protein
MQELLCELCHGLNRGLCSHRRPCLTPNKPRLLAPLPTPQKVMYAVTDGFSGLNGGWDTPGTGLNFLVHNMVGTSQGGPAGIGKFTVGRADLRARGTGGAGRKRAGPRGRRPLRLPTPPPALVVPAPAVPAAGVGRHLDGGQGR